MTVLTAARLEGYTALYAWLVASGLGVPPGEDVLIASVGALVASGDLARWVAIPLAVAAVVTSDTLMFSGGRMAGVALTGRAAWLPERPARVLAALVGRRETLAIAIARFVPGLRTVVFVSVGARGLSRGRFLLVDACAATVWVPLVMTCGAAVAALFFGDHVVLAEAWR